VGADCLALRLRAGTAPRRAHLRELRAALPLCEIGAGGLASGDRATEAAIACLDAEVPGWVASSGSAAAARLDPLERRLARSPHGARRQPPGC